MDKSEHGPPARRRFAVSSIAAALVAASLIGLYFRAELATYVKRSAGEHDAAGIGTVGAPVAEQETQFPGQDSQKADSLARDPARHQQAEPDGKPYLIDVEVARHGPGWTDDPWVPTRG